MSTQENPPKGVVASLVRFTLDNKLVVFLLFGTFVAWGVAVAPFDWKIDWLPRDPVPVDAIPDIGENQQVVFTEWPGQSPEDVQDQVTYPLTTALLGIPGVKTIRAISMFGFSSIYVIFKEHVGYYWGRTRLLEKLASLPPNLLPKGVRPTLGPDATALGQVFWYTLEGRDEKGRPTGGWDLQELRTIQDWYVRYALMAVEGVSEVASVGGFVREYLVEVDPEALRGYKVTFPQVVRALKAANRDVGARTMEVNGVEYLVRGLGRIQKIEDIENAVVAARGGTPVLVKHVARVSLGPAMRRGLLDKAGAEAVGGVVVARYGANPLAVIQRVKEKIREIAPSLPKKTLPDGRVSQVTIVPFYDRSGLIHETLETLNTALSEEILVTVLVILVMILHVGSALLVSGLLPAAVLMTFIAMKLFGVDANVVALSGIAIAIGTMVDMGIVMTENILGHQAKAGPDADGKRVILEATAEVGGAVVTAVATTVVSFLPVFTMQAAEGKLFKPLAFTKTFALIASVLVSLFLIPPLAHLILRPRGKGAVARWIGRLSNVALAGLGVGLAIRGHLLAGLVVALVGLARFGQEWVPQRHRDKVSWLVQGLLALLVGFLLAEHWMPLGHDLGLTRNVLFVGLVLVGLLGGIRLFLKAYPFLLRWSLDHKAAFAILPLALVFFGMTAWLGWKNLWSFLPGGQGLAQVFPGFKKQFMPPLDEGSFLYMPTTMPHASIGEVKDILQKQDVAISRIPEVENVVGKLGRVESALDPAPLSMIETIIQYKPKYLQTPSGKHLLFKFDPDKVDFYRDVEGRPVPAPDGKPYKVQGTYVRDDNGRLVPDDKGRPFRLWRPPLDPKLNPGRKAWPGIRRPDDIWQLILKAAQVPGSTSAPKLQPIATRIVMLQTGMRAAMGLKIRGPDLKTIEKAALAIEAALRKVPGIVPDSVSAERVVGKPYLEVIVDRRKAARYGLNAEDVQMVFAQAVGGVAATTTIEGRERYLVRARYPRELRLDPEALEEILVPTPSGEQIPLRTVAKVTYRRGPQAIKSEDTFLVAYVTFDKKENEGEVEIVQRAKAYLEKLQAEGKLKLPPGVSYTFAGNYENQVRSEKRLRIVLPVALGVIFLLLYLQFRSTWVTTLVFSGIAVAWAGGFLLIWLYNQPWFLDANLFGRSLREVFNVRPMQLSVAVWVGFLALFGIATDNGVIVATYLQQIFGRDRPETREAIRQAALEAGVRRARPSLMTTATTLLALLPVLSAVGRGADIMVPMAIPSFGGMLLALLTMLIVPVAYAWVKELGLSWRTLRGSGPAPGQGVAPGEADGTVPAGDSEAHRDTEDSSTSESAAGSAPVDLRPDPENGTPRAGDAESADPAHGRE